jgi:hypothetical protein
MGMRVVVGSVASAIVLMAWGFMFWVVLSAPGGMARAVPDETALMDELRVRLPESDTYFFPLPPEAEPGRDEAPALEAFRQRKTAGPVGIIHFRRTGYDPLSPINYARDFLHLLLSSLLAALLLAAALPVLESYASRAAFVFGLGVFATVAVRLSDPVWWHLPWAHFLYGALYDVAAWLIAGLVLAGIVKTPRGMSHLTDPSKPLWKRALEVD